jgi:hypothetical protein
MILPYRQIETLFGSHKGFQSLIVQRSKAAVCIKNHSTGSSGNFIYGACSPSDSGNARRQGQGFNAPPDKGLFTDGGNR